MKKSISITLDQDLILTSPTYKQTKVNMKTEGLNNLEIVQILSQMLSNKILDLGKEINLLQESIVRNSKGIA